MSCGRRTTMTSCCTIRATSCSPFMRATRTTSARVASPLALGEDLRIHCRFRRLSLCVEYAEFKGFLGDRPVMHRLFLTVGGEDFFRLLGEGSSPAARRTVPMILMQ